MPLSDRRGSPVYEYGIARKAAVVAGEAFEAHREGMTEHEADEWLREWREMSDDDHEVLGARDMFVVVRRPMGAWVVNG